MFVSVLCLSLFNLLNFHDWYLFVYLSLTIFWPFNKISHFCIFRHWFLPYEDLNSQWQAFFSYRVFRLLSNPQTSNSTFIIIIFLGLMLISSHICRIRSSFVVGLRRWIAIFWLVPHKIKWNCLGWVIVVVSTFTIDVYTVRCNKLFNSWPIWTFLVFTPVL